jgi:hypothetical protein
LFASNEAIPQSREANSNQSGLAGAFDAAIGNDANDQSQASFATKRKCSVAALTVAALKMPPFGCSMLVLHPFQLYQS